MKLLLPLAAALAVAAAARAAQPAQGDERVDTPVELQALNLRTSFNAMEGHMRRNPDYKPVLGPVSERLAELEERVTAAERAGDVKELERVRSDFRALRRELHRDPVLPDHLK